MPTECRRAGRASTEDCQSLSMGAGKAENRVAFVLSAGDRRQRRQPLNLGADQWIAAADRGVGGSGDWRSHRGPGHRRG